MKFKEAKASFDDGISLSFLLPISEKESVQSIVENISKFDPEKEYSLTFGKEKKSRSMDANSYMWVLCDKIAHVLGSTKEDVYRKAIREVGVFTDVAVQEGEPYQTLVSSWGHYGIGYFSEVFDSGLTDAKGNPMKRVRLYKGSHKYTPVQLGRVIDWVVEEAKTLGIETLTENKLKELEASWT